MKSVPAKSSFSSAWQSTSTVAPRRGLAREALNNSASLSLLG